MHHITVLYIAGWFDFFTFLRIWTEVLKQTSLCFKNVLTKFDFDLKVGQVKTLKFPILTKYIGLESFTTNFKISQETVEIPSSQ